MDSAAIGHVHNIQHAINSRAGIALMLQLRVIVNSAGHSACPYGATLSPGWQSAAWRQGQSLIWAVGPAALGVDCGDNKELYLL